MYNQDDRKKYYSVCSEVFNLYFHYKIKWVRCAILNRNNFFQCCFIPFLFFLCSKALQTNLWFLLQNKNIINNQTNIEINAIKKIKKKSSADVIILLLNTKIKFFMWNYTIFFSNFVCTIARKRKPIKTFTNST